MAANNPQLQQTLQFINLNGGNAKQVFFQEAQKRGVDPNEIIRQLQGLNTHR
jgi:hypothetical protein